VEPVGLDVVEFFAERKAKVSIIEMMPMIGRDLDVITKVDMMSIIKEYDIDVNTSTALVEVTSDHFKVKKGDTEENIDFDYGFVCMGMKPENTGLKELQEHFSEKNIPVINIGDSARARKIMDGVREGSELNCYMRKYRCNINITLIFYKCAYKNDF